MNKTSVPGWESPATRMTWLVETKFGGNKSAMGRAIGMTHVAVARAMTGETTPGARMMSLIVEKLGVNAAWLLHGQGEPFAQADKNPTRRRGTPISDVLLGGVPRSSQSQLSAATLDMLGMLSQTQYWLRLRNWNPLLGQATRGFRENDMILIETSRKLFPQPREFRGQLCVVSFGDRKDTMYHLAEVTRDSDAENGGPELIAEILEYQLLTDTGKLFTLMLTSDGELRVLPAQTSSKSGRNRRSQPSTEVSVPSRWCISPSRIVGVWTGMIYRTN